MESTPRKRGSGAPFLVVLGWIFLILGGLAVFTTATILVVAPIGIGLGFLLTAVVVAIEAR
ncbi:hypothetical protein AB0J42_17765 [Nonomuraea sp. NPDC049649]|uniref:hypothetical protein n=1 Tax=Nonomuraea sp. NPDC049649 TaxID=3155776 RepID=UPI003444F574